MTDMSTRTVSNINKLAALRGDVVRVGKELAACCKNNVAHKGPLKRQAKRLGAHIEDLKIALAPELANMTGEEYLRRAAAIARIERRKTRTSRNYKKLIIAQGRATRAQIREGLLNGERDYLTGMAEAPKRKKAKKEPSAKDLAAAADLAVKHAATEAWLEERRVRAEERRNAEMDAEAYRDEALEASARALNPRAFRPRAGTARKAPSSPGKSRRLAAAAQAAVSPAP